jgi:dihydrofolate synthase/folylpolyglutamate synthase
VRYDEAITLLDGAARFGMNPTLEGVRDLCAALGDPQDAFASVQITGTNGKTSTARMSAALLAGERLRVGLYTSPHLERYPERIEIDGAPVADESFAEAIAAAAAAAERLRGAGAVGTAEGFTEFELLTAAALWLFRERAVDVAVLEVGLGGRWDATSVVSPSVAAITGVGLDHTAILGDTLEAIAAEKAAIIKPASAPILGPGTVGVERIFLAQAEAVGSHARAVREADAVTPVDESLTVRYAIVSRPQTPGGAVVVDVRGVHAVYAALALRAPAYQAANVATAIAIAEAALGRALDPDRARAVLASLALPGRFELVSQRPPLIVDGSHNPHAASALADAVLDAFPDPAARPVVLLGILADKDAAGIVSALAPVAGGIAVTQSSSARALPAAELAAIVCSVTGAEPIGVFASVGEALAALGSSANPRGLLVTGSITTAGEARRIVRDGWTTRGV